MKKWTFWLVIIVLNSVELSAGDWVKSFGDSLGNVVIAGVAADSEENAIITGSFTSGKLVLDASNILHRTSVTALSLTR